MNKTNSNLNSFKDSIWQRYRKKHRKTKTCICCKTVLEESFHYCPNCGFRVLTEQPTPSSLEKSLITSDIRTYKQSQSKVQIEPEPDLATEDADPDMNLLQAQQAIEDFINTAPDEDFSKQFEDEN